MRVADVASCDAGRIDLTERSEVGAALVQEERGTAGLGS